MRTAVQREEEMPTDFKSLQARFQNAVLDPTSRLPGSAWQAQGSRGSGEPDPSPPTQGVRSGPPESHARPLRPGKPQPAPSCAARAAGSAPGLTASAAARRREAAPAGGALPGLGGPAQPPASKLQSWETAVRDPADRVDPSTFRYTLQIWKTASSLDEGALVEQPRRRARTLEPARPAEGHVRRLAKGSGALLLHLPTPAKTEIAKNLLHVPTVTSGCSQESASKRKSGVRESQRPQTRPLPSIQALGPPPKKPVRPPKVDLSPFLTTTVQNGSPQIRGAAEEVYMTPEDEEPESYQDVLVLQKCLNSANLCPTPKVKTFTRETGIPENKVLQSSFFSGMNSNEPESYEDLLELRNSMGSINLHPIVETPTYELDISENEVPQSSFLFGVNRSEKAMTDGARENLSSWEKENPYSEQEKLTKEKRGKKEKELMKKLKITGSEEVLYRAQVNEDCNAGKSMLPLKQGDVVDIIRISNCPSGKWLAKDEKGNFGYVYVKALKVDKETIAKSQQSMKPKEVIGGVYDDVEGKQSDFRSEMTWSPSFSSDSFSEETTEETYDDVQSEDVIAAREDGKRKGLGKLFLTEKNLFKVKNHKSKENLDNLSNSIPNLADVYDDIDPDQKASKEREKMKRWMQKFPTPKEKRKSTEVFESEATWYADVHSSTSRNVLKNMLEKEKNRKMTKEEKSFRERFRYTKEIVVINTAIVEYSASTPKKGKLDLRITQGETLEVIDISDGNEIICRNSEGKYGYVSVEHLTFLEG
ncbi:FYN-binding protein 2 isoform X3 [Rhinatrema bivittatum]|uniref:FYN-binding protein 2 isoform X3 n=1 Tax=Rhinatrema bivittatum TaxID=194408 RepID=UPI00112A4BBF|nr:FYN-binding protein 2 isoform X3 [Rhinatrema bivittatum]